MFLQERSNTWHECSERLGNLRSGFKDIAAWLDSAQHQLKVYQFKDIGIEHIFNGSRLKPIMRYVFWLILDERY